MAWLYLVIAGIFEIGFATCLRMSENFSRLLPTIAFIVFSMMSFFFMGLSLNQISIGTAYAVWTGIGAFGVALIGIMWFGDPVAPLRLFFLFTLILSIVGLKLVSH